MDYALEVKDEDLELLLIGLHEKYGYDFTSYSRASLKRRLNRILSMEKFPSFAEMRFYLLEDESYLRRFIEEITVNVTEMFRDPAFFNHLRNKIIPILATYPFIRIWVAGCATGEEAYSMAILIEEAKLSHKTLIYATDINPRVLESAKLGIFPVSLMKQYSENYILSGGTEEFSKYYIAKYDKVIFKESLRNKIVFSNHNLVSDNSFNSFQLISCRNVLIYFQTSLQNRVFDLFDGSLEPLGFLTLGNKETMRFSTISNRYKQLEGNEKIWRKSEI
jgi:chemotaxis protein methyltransferase CheR